MYIRFWTWLSNGGAFAGELIGRLNRRSRRDLAIWLDVHLWSLSRPSACQLIHWRDRMVLRNYLLPWISYIWFRVFNAWFLEPFVENILRVGLVQNVTAKWEVLVPFVAAVLDLVGLVHKGLALLVRSFPGSRPLNLLKPCWVSFWNVSRVFLKVLIYIVSFWLWIEVVSRIHHQTRPLCWRLFRHQLHLLCRFETFDGVVTVLLGHPVKSVLKGNHNLLCLIFHLFLMHKFRAFRNLIINILHILKRLSRTIWSIERHLLGPLTLAKWLIFARSVF